MQLDFSRLTFSFLFSKGPYYLDTRFHGVMNSLGSVGSLEKASLTPELPHPSITFDESSQLFNPRAEVSGLRKIVRYFFPFQYKPLTFSEKKEALEKIKETCLNILNDARDLAATSHSIDIHQYLFEDLKEFQRKLTQAERGFEALVSLHVGDEREELSAAVNALNQECYQALIKTIQTVKSKDPLKSHSPSTHVERDIQLLEEHVKAKNEEAKKESNQVWTWKNYLPHKIMAFIELNRDDWFKSLEKNGKKFLILKKSDAKTVDGKRNEQKGEMEWTIVVHRKKHQIFINLSESLIPTPKKEGQSPTEATQNSQSPVPRPNFKTVKKALGVDLGKFIVKYFTIIKDGNLAAKVKKYMRQFNGRKNIIQTFALSSIVKNYEKHTLAYVEWYPLGDLREFLTKQTVTPEHRLKITLDVIRGLSSMHEEGDEKTAHCDVKSRNILVQWVKTSQGSLPEAVWGDLDFCVDASSEHSLKRGTLETMAPEVQSKEKTRYSMLPTDMFGLGCILHDIWIKDRVLPWKGYLEDRKRKKSEIKKEGKSLGRSFTLAEKQKWDQEVEKIEAAILIAKRTAQTHLSRYLNTRDNPIHRIMFKCFAEDPSERMTINEARRIYEDYLLQKIPVMAERFGVKAPDPHLQDGKGDSVQSSAM